MPPRAITVSKKRHPIRHRCLPALNLLIAPKGFRSKRLYRRKFPRTRPKVKGVTSGRYRANNRASERTGWGGGTKRGGVGRGEDRGEKGRVGKTRSLSMGSQTTFSGLGGRRKTRWFVHHKAREQLSPKDLIRKKKNWVFVARNGTGPPSGGNQI